MKYKKFGRTGLKVSEMCLGTMVFGNQVDEAEAIKIIDKALDSGINFIDTADFIYAEGRSEQIVGKALKLKRQSVILATKLGQGITGPAPNDTGLSRKHIMEGIEDSLRRLQTDYIDLYYAHLPDYDTPIEETLHAFDDLIRQGKVRYIGYSNCRAWQICQALWVSDRHGLDRFSCVQTRYSLLYRDNEYELLSFCASEGLGVCTYNPLAGGLLTGKHDPNKPPAKGTRFAHDFLGPGYYERYWLANNFEAVASLKQIAEKQGHKLAQFALAWILSNRTVTSVITGVSTTKQLEENLAAVDLELTEEELKACDDVWHKIRPPRFLYGR